MRTVRVSETQVAYFKSTWPGCTLQGPITFTYADNGDLVDIMPVYDDENEENSRALLALSYDAAKGYGCLIK